MAVLADSVIHLSYPLAFLAGLVSFLSPCVFPLAPAYVAHLSGRAGQPVLEEVAVGQGGVAALRPASASTPLRVPLLAGGVAFVLGFSTVFIALFYVLVALDVATLRQHQAVVDTVAGAIVIVLGLQTMGLLRLGVLLRDRRIHTAPRGTGLVPSFLLGVTFAAGWSPCIGPQLTAILAVASQGDFAGLPVMVVYCLGLAVPFLALALLADRLQGTIRAVNRHMGVISVVAGALLLVFGVLLVTHNFTYFNRFSFQSPFDL